MDSETVTVLLLRCEGCGDVHDVAVYRTADGAAIAASEHPDHELVATLEGVPVE